MKTTPFPNVSTARAIALAMLRDIADDLIAEKKILLDACQKALDVLTKPAGTNPSAEADAVRALKEAIKAATARQVEGKEVDPLCHQ